MCHSASHHIWIKKLWIAKSMSQEIGVSHLPCFVLNLIFISLYFVFDQLNDEYPAFCTLADDDLGCIESSALRYVAKRCKMLQNVAKHCIELWYIALAQWRMEAVGCIGCDRMHSVPSRPKMHCIALLHSTPVHLWLNCILQHLHNVQLHNCTSPQSGKTWLFDASSPGSACTASQAGTHTTAIQYNVEF